MSPTPGSDRRLSEVRLPDFSYAGYHMGDRAIPDVPAVTDAKAYGVVADGVTDDTAALRRALDATKDGALVLPEGRIVILDTVRIPRGHVVVRGRGAAKTFLVMPKSLEEIHPPGDPLHHRSFGFLEARGTEPEVVLGRVTALAARGSRRLELDSPIMVKPGELVRVRMSNAEGLLRTLLGPTLAPGPQTHVDMDHYVDWVAPIEKIVGRGVVLSRPLRVDVRPEWSAEVLAFHPTLEEIGIEGITFEFPGTPKAVRMEEEGFFAIYLRGVSNAWVRDVEIVDADNGITLDECRFARVERVRLRVAHRTVPSGHHALWAKASQDCLFTDFRIETQFEDELTVEGFANGNVFMRGVGEALGLDHHRNAPYENLFTDLDVGSPARLFKSGGDAERGPHAGVRETLWNVRHRGHPPPLPGALHYDRPVDSGWPELNLIGVKGYAATSPDSPVWIDEAPDAPPNLYEAQRAARLGRRSP